MCRVLLRIRGDHLGSHEPAGVAPGPIVLELRAANPDGAQHTGRSDPAQYVAIGTVDAGAEGERPARAGSIAHSHTGALTGAGDLDRRSIRPFAHADAPRGDRREQARSGARLGVDPGSGRPNPQPGWIFVRRRRLVAVTAANQRRPPARTQRIVVAAKGLVVSGGPRPLPRFDSIRLVRNPVRPVTTDATGLLLRMVHRCETTQAMCLVERGAHVVIV
jgi:hypothetical protein